MAYSAAAFAAFASGGATFPDEPLFVPLRFSGLRFDRSTLSDQKTDDAAAGGDVAIPRVPAAFTEDLRSLGDFSFERGLVAEAARVAAKEAAAGSRRPFQNLVRPPPVTAASASSGSEAKTSLEEEGWVCSVCTFKSEALVSKCGFCGAPKTPAVVRTPAVAAAALTAASRPAVSEPPAPIHVPAPNPAPSPSVRRVGGAGGGVAGGAGNWTCRTCTFVNPAIEGKCGVCGAAPPLAGDDRDPGPLRAPAMPPPIGAITREQSVVPPGSWPCGTCTLFNAPAETTCTACGTPAAAVRTKAVTPAVSWSCSVSGGVYGASLLCDRLFIARFFGMCAGLHGRKRACGAVLHCVRNQEVVILWMMLAHGGHEARAGHFLGIPLRHVGDGAEKIWRADFEGLIRRSPSRLRLCGLGRYMIPRMMVAQVTLLVLQWRSAHVQCSATVAVQSLVWKTLGRGDVPQVPMPMCLTGRLHRER